MSPGSRPVRIVAAVAALVVAADQALKAAVVSEVAAGDRIEVFSFFGIVFTRNRGIAFGLLGDAQEWLVIAVTLVALGVLLLVFTRAAVGRMGWIGVGLVAGGALGNLADRVRDGSVVDFIKFDLWPAFNLADAAITVGVILLLLGQLQRDAPEEEPGGAADEAEVPPEAPPGPLPGVRPPGGAAGAAGEGP
ncbi:MAG: signal peptidase II [Solirubrobacterales bacterium]